MVNFSLEGKIALVTGASYGIGFGIASAYAEAGATICFNDINQEKVDMGLASYKEKGIEAHGYVCDVTDEEQVKAMVAKIKEEVGVIDILVNNAGIIMRKPMLEMEANEFRKVIDVDLNAPFIVSKAVIPGYDREGTWKDHQHLLHDERTRTRDCIRVRCCKGRTEDAYKKHLLRVRRVQHPVQRYRTWIHRDTSDSSAA